MFKSSKKKHVLNRLICVIKQPYNLHVDRMTYHNWTYAEREFWLFKYHNIIQTAQFKCDLVDLLKKISFEKAPFLKVEGLQEMPDLLAFLLPSYSVKVLMSIFRLISFPI